MKAPIQKTKPRSMPFQAGVISTPSYKNPKMLVRFISERGRILPRRITGVSAKTQRMLKSAIKVARILALLPFSNK
jgi:small subunit ribosomal protein S18